LLLKNGEAAESSGEVANALRLYLEAKQPLDLLRTKSPDFESALVACRLMHIADRIASLREQIEGGEAQRNSGQPSSANRSRQVALVDWQSDTG